MHTGTLIEWKLRGSADLGRLELSGMVMGHPRYRDGQQIVRKDVQQVDLVQMEVKCLDSTFYLDSFED